MQGKIGFNSELGVGSTFWAWFPHSAAPSVGDLPSAAAGSSVSDETERNKAAGKLRILVAEDNNSNYMLLKAVLREYNLSRAENGLEAVKMAAEDTYDIILMDIRMPEMNGLEATAEIRKFNAEIPIVALTANAFDSDRDDAIDAGCSGFLTKPLNKEALFRILADI